MDETIVHVLVSKYINFKYALVNTTIYLLKYFSSFYIFIISLLITPDSELALIKIAPKAELYPNSISS